jgi:hypothetical protein
MIKKCQKNLEKLKKWLASRTQITKNVGKDVGKKEPSYTLIGNVN